MLCASPASGGSIENWIMFENGASKRASAVLPGLRKASDRKQAFKQTRRMKLTIALIIVSFLNTTAYSQKGDYKIVRDGITKLSCKTFDSLTVVETNLVLQNLDTTILDKNVDIYYRDLGWSYYRIYLFTKDTVLIRKSIDSYLKANFHKSHDPSTLWELAHLNYILSECSTGKQFIEQFKAVTEKQYWREDQIILMKKRCDN